jgi:capsid protein
VKWIPPGFAWVDPLKDIKAQMMAVRAGFKSRAEVVSEQGYDAEAIDREIAADNARADALGLSYDTDPRPDDSNASDESEA